ncbi:MAG: HEAT repeat domain-containing protein [Spirochaetales bacterium]|nr:HEAT repeat domain-containing protein [Spirochaetales bacterium]MCF7939252.1 HEAT repeat domain-containing protein [Spirochaetales bacterium]
MFSFFGELSIELIIGITAALIVVVAGVVWFIVWRARVKRRIRESGESIEAAQVLLQQLNRRPTAKLARQLLAHIPDTALFTIFICALENKKIADELIRWIDQSGDMFVYRRLALSGKGEEFNGQKACSLFSDHLDRIREMTGDPEWPARYMAVKILLHDNDERSKRAVRDMWNDPHTLIRRTLVEEFTPSEDKSGEKESDDLYTRLIQFITADPVFEVRRAAKKRIVSEFAERYQVDYSDLAPEQILHHIEQFDPESSEDRNSALEFLLEDNLELRFAAARFLDQAGSLETLFAEVDFADQDLLQRNKKKLKNAVEVNCDSFLEKVKETDNPASLLLAAEILTEQGKSAYIPPLAEHVFSRTATGPGENRLFEQTVQSIRERGPESAVRRMAEELRRRSSREEDAALLLENLPAFFPFVTVPVLTALLKDPSFNLRERLHEAFLRLDPSYYLDELFSVLKAGRDAYPHSVRISCLLLLGKLKLSYCMQFLLEQMPILPFEEARDFSVHLKDYDGKLFQKRVLDLMNNDDGKVKAALISAVPATGNKEFLKPIREAVGDADPEVRRAAVWALLEYGDQRSVKGSVDLLRDPVERVRIEAARALGSKGKPSILNNFSEILSDPNEVESVKLAALEGLSASKEKKSVDLLVEQLKDRGEELTEQTIEALSAKSDKDLVKPLVTHLKDAEPELRDKISEAFKRMGEQAETPLLELLREDIASLTPHITYVLEQTGCVEQTIRKLNHRDAEVRREAADILSRIGTTSAFRGIVLAARDPDEDVRVMVTRALERLNTESDSEILEELKNDPDKRIRKYTLWAMERITSKNSE